MKEFVFHVPVRGIITVKIVSDDAKEAVEIFLDKQEQILQHPAGKLEAIMEDVIIYNEDIDENQVN